MDVKFHVFVKIIRTRLLGYRPNFRETFNQRVLEQSGDICRPLIESGDFYQESVGRAFAHFMGQVLHRPVFNLVLTEIVAFVSLIPFLAWVGVRSLIFKPGDKITCEGLHLAHRSRYEVNKEIYQVPKELSGQNIITSFYEKEYLSWRDMFLVLSVLRTSLTLGYRWNFQFVLKVAKDLATLNGNIVQYQPKFILVYREYDCSLSLITFICHIQGIQVFNVMHGDKYFSTFESYFNVDRCYCWHAYYVELFRRQRVGCKDYRLFEIPALLEKDKISISAAERVGVVMPADYTLASSRQGRKRSMGDFISGVNKLAEKYKISLRPHPLHPDHFNAVKHRFSPRLEISDVRKEKSIDFVRGCKVVVGAYSTVLLESAVLGRDTIVIDTPRVAEISDDHYVFQYDNVQIVALENIVDTVSNIMNYEG